MGKSRRKQRSRVGRRSRSNSKVGRRSRRTSRVGRRSKRSIRSKRVSRKRLSRKRSNLRRKQKGGAEPEAEPEPQPEPQPGPGPQPQLEPSSQAARQRAERKAQRVAAKKKRKKKKKQQLAAKKEKSWGKMGLINAYRRWKALRMLPGVGELEDGDREGETKMVRDVREDGSFVAAVYKWASKESKWVKHKEAWADGGIPRALPGGERTGEEMRKDMGWVKMQLSARNRRLRNALKEEEDRLFRDKKNSDDSVNREMEEKEMMTLLMMKVDLLLGEQALSDAQSTRSSLWRASETSEEEAAAAIDVDDEWAAAEAAWEAAEAEAEAAAEAAAEESEGASETSEEVDGLV